MPLGRDLVYLSAAALTSPVWATSLLRTGKWRTDWRGRFGHTPSLPPSPDKPKTLLLYGVSVGEINLIRNLVDHLERHAPHLRLVVAASTNTGHARATALYADRHRVVRFPYDLSFAVRRFLDAVQPDAVALVELEVWPNFMDECTRRGVPVAVVNGRLTPRSFRGYRRIRPLIAPAFRRLAAVAAQTDEYAERFRALGVPADRVRVLDTMKWDTAAVEDTVNGAEQLAADLGIDRSRPLIVAGSTAPGEHELLIRTRPADTQLLLAPRKPEWFDDVMRHAPNAVRRTAGTGDQGSGFRSSGVDAAAAASPSRTPNSEPSIFLLDTIGELRAAYSLADVCIVGRSFTGRLHGSDMMEPIALNKPTVVGPHHADFADTMHALLDAGGVIVSDDPMGAADELLRNRSLAAEIAAAGRAVILSRQGATKRHAAMLLDLLNR